MYFEQLASAPYRPCWVATFFVCHHRPSELAGVEVSEGCLGSGQKLQPIARCAKQYAPEQAISYTGIFASREEADQAVNAFGFQLRQAL